MNFLALSFVYVAELREKKTLFSFLTGYYDCESSSRERIENYTLAHILKLTVVEIVSLLSSCISLENVS